MDYMADILNLGCLCWKHQEVLGELKASLAYMAYYGVS